MKNIWILLSFLMSVTVQAQDLMKLNEQFDTSSVLNKHYYGFSLYNLDTKQVAFSRNEDKHFTPASNTKVFTLFAAIKLIGDSIPGLAYVERGDSLIFWGTGDPTFCTLSWIMAKSIIS